MRFLFKDIFRILRLNLSLSEMEEGRARRLANQMMTTLPMVVKNRTVLKEPLNTRKNKRWFRRGSTVCGNNVLPPYPPRSLAASRLGKGCAFGLLKEAGQSHLAHEHPQLAPAESDSPPPPR